ncbi:bifunctional hydroxymethylpyrimidine kinase/phosphomethylpyrimidine kinase [Luteolibacter algae]|uniref:hydroxymethylpyrimidine kinase n=1 Tax=Luteolibacter algae TaxID=454151 RepID=A0ABW5D842_9BACT
MYKSTSNQPGIRPILTIAGSDCSAGAGLQADLKTFQHFHLHGLTAVTCIVSETANIVRRVDPVAPEMMEDQICLMMETFPLEVVKTGMLGSAEHVNCVADIFSKHRNTKLVIDPVMVASTGASLLEAEAVASYRDRLLPLAYLITPNLPEAETLLGEKIESLTAMKRAAEKLAGQYNCAVLLKGGHLNEEECTDILFDEGNFHSFTSPRLKVKASHGTGCTLAAAVASALALGRTLPEACSIAKTYLNACLASSYSISGPNGETIYALNQGVV